MFFGREPRLPWDNILQTDSDQIDPCIDEWVVKQRDRVKQAYELANIHINQKAKQRK